MSGPVPPDCAGDRQGPGDVPQDLAAGSGPGVSLGAPAAGGGIGNTPPPSSKWVAAEDWFEWTPYIDWNGIKWAELRERLDECKRCAAASDAPEEVTGWQECGHRLEVDANGANLGKGRKGLYCKYRLNFAEYLSVLLIDREKAHRTQPSGCLTVSGEGCLLSPARGWWEMGNTLIDVLGGRVVGEKLSRVDICLDMPWIAIDEFLAAYREERYICRANSRGLEEGNGTTIYFGRHPIRARIYDKRAEVLAKARPSIRLAMKLYRWGGQIPDTATRVEFQLRREVLKRFGVNGPQDYFARRASIVDYLTRQWLRLTVEPVKRSSHNQSRATVLPLWDDVWDAFAEWGAGADAELAPLPREDADTDQLMKQAKGVIKTAMKERGIEVLNEEEFLRVATAWLRGV